MLDVIQAGAGEWHGRKPQDVFCTTSRTHLPKGACRPLLDTPCGWRGCGIEPFRTRATSGRCITSQGFHAPTPRPSSSRLDSDRASFPRSPEPHRPRGLPRPFGYLRPTLSRIGCAMHTQAGATCACAGESHFGYERRVFIARLRWMFSSVLCAVARSLAGRCSDAATLAA